MKFGDRALILMAFGLMLSAFWSMTTAFSSWYLVFYGTDSPLTESANAPLRYIETKLRPLATPKKPPGSHDWLAKHEEFGQTFSQYMREQPVRAEGERNTIWITLVGDFKPEQRRILDETRKYMELFYGLPVKMAEPVPLARLPKSAVQFHPELGKEQLLTGYVLNDLLESNIPKDAVAYLAFTALDLTPGRGWNFVFGQANLHEHTGVWSIERFGDPRVSADAYRQCLRRTMNVATHETGHIFTIQHCIAFECNMNGANSLPESDRAPLLFCPVCLRKVCWNLGLDPIEHLRKLHQFYEAHGLVEDAAAALRFQQALERE